MHQRNFEELAEVALERIYGRILPGEVSIPILLSKFPIDIRAVARAEGMNVDPVPALPSPGGGELAGHLDFASGTARVSERFGPGATNFTIAHELGHFLFHKGRQSAFRDAPGVHTSSDPQEREAHQFAKKLLTPKWAVQWFFRATFQRDDFVASCLSEAEASELAAAGGDGFSDPTTLCHNTAALAEAVVRVGPWGRGVFVPLPLRFGVSNAAMIVRLRELGVVR